MIQTRSFDRSETFSQEWIKIHTDEDQKNINQSSKESFTLLSVADFANFHTWTKDKNTEIHHIWKFKRCSIIRLVGFDGFEYNEYDVLDICTC